MNKNINEDTSNTKIIEEEIQENIDTTSYSAFLEADEFSVEESNNPNPESEEYQEKEKKKKRILIISGIILGSILLIYFGGIIYLWNRFVPGTYINGINVGGQTDQQAVETLNNSALNRQVTIIGSNDEMNQISGGEVGLEFIDITQLTSLLRKQNRLLWPFDFIIPDYNDFTTAYSINKDLLKMSVDRLSLVSGRDITQPINASFYYDGNQFSIIPSQLGTQPNVPKLEKAIENALVNNISTINLAQDGLYLEADLTENSPIMQSNLNKLNTAIEAQITINFPGTPVVLNKEGFNTWLIANEDGVSLDGSKLDNYVASLAAQFNTYGRNYNFKSTAGNTYTFPNNNAGFILNQQSEASQLNDQILNGTTVIDEPIWAQANGLYIPGNQLTGNYIEVSLANQTMWLYRNNSLVSSSTIVSGNASTNQRTATGLFFIKSKNQNANLIVRLPNGTSQNMTVHYWFPYTDSFGFESASWRNQFGGSIYTNQGTDGDIDVPESMGQTLNNNIAVNYPVVIY